MEILLSNLPPLRYPNRDVFSCFEELLRTADGLRIASGYISTDSLTELKKLVEVNKKSSLELVIGMHGFEGLTNTQYEAARYLHDFLKASKTGCVKIATSFRFHGKVYSFLKNNSPFAGILGSSNLSSIFDNPNVYEADIFLDEREAVSQIDRLILDLLSRASTVLDEWDAKIVREDESRLLEGHEGAERISRDRLAEIISSKTETSFRIPIKSDDAPQSNLNAYFGKGRENKRGFVKPRHWYEVELIVPKDITSQSQYPKAGYPERESIITVYTDDGWKFRCKISGDYSKNFRSADDLKILGRWIKGRLENRGCLRVGQPVTREVLNKYGRDHFDLTGTSDPSVWYLNFGV